MRARRRRARAGALALGLGLAVALAAPGTAGAQVCTQVTTLAVAFGAYDEHAATPLEAVGQVRVTCDTGVSYEVQLGPGGNSSSSFSPRRMAGGPYFLDYNLYLDAARTRVWGDATGGTEILSAGGTGGQDVYSIYGRVFPLQVVGVGAYGDTVTVSVIF